VIGRHVSHFYVIRSLGSGGMGTVYEAQDTRLPRSVAIKFLNPSLSRNIEAVRRFKREARLASSLNHPNICTVLDVDEGHGQSFIAMELLRGNSLKDRLAAGPMTTDEILDIGVQVADALAAAHEHGIMHRDITPGNIFLTADRAVKLLDFGLAKQFASFDGDEPLTDDLTEPGTLAGTIHYMAPEQFGGGGIDARCDLFSLGAVLYHMATGSRPFQAKSRNDVMALIRDQPHVPLRQLAPQQSARLEATVDKLLAKRPADRYQSAASLRADLDLIRQTRSQSSLRIRPATVTSVGVLPFTIIGPSTPELEQFRDGLAEDISRRLTGVRGVRVAPRTSTRRLIDAPVRDIARCLDVRLVVEGSVQQAGARVKVIGTLVDAPVEQPLLPSACVTRDLGDIIDAQDEIARDLVSAFAVAFAREATTYRAKPEAYQAFKRGEQQWKRPFSGGWRSAIEHFQYAIECDERFAMAHVALGAAYNFLGFYSLLKPNVAFAVARHSLERALDIDDTLAAAHAERGLALFGGDWDWTGAEQSFRRALQIDAGCAVGHMYYGWLLVLLGRHEAGLAEADIGEAQAPGSRLVTAGRAQTLYLAHRFKDAIAACDASLGIRPDYPYALHLRAQSYRELELHDEARADLERAAALTDRAPFYLGLLGHLYGHRRLRPQAIEVIAELDRKRDEMYVPPQSYVYTYAGLGERQKALEYQERAYEDGASPLNYLTPFIRDLYALDPHQKKRLEQMRLVL
jgi:TolB-like protein/Tfp pilus assembly protein PilF